ncbi:MAG: hypothetical protein ABIU29_08115 [Chthoniobacterales bacterium]
MKANIFRSIAVVCGLSSLFTSLLPMPSAQAEDSANRSRASRIEGVWDSDVTIQDCSSGAVLATFRGVGLFIRGGALEQQNNLPPNLGKDALGQWRFLGGSHYTAHFQFFRFDSTGVWLGTQKVTRDIQLDAAGGTFSGVISSTTLDTDDNVIATGCGVETATRVVD